MTSGAAPDAVKAARPVLNGGCEETCRRVTRLAPTQHHHTGQVLASVFGTREDHVFLELQSLLAPFGITRFYTDGWGAYRRHLDPDKHTVGKQYTQKIERKHTTLRARIKRLEAVWKQSLYTRRGDVIYRARLRTDLLDNRSLDMLLEISKRLIC
jgi:IS1 family transposase